MGENFHNHVLTGLIVEAKDPVAPGHLNTSEAALFCKSEPGYTVPDLQIQLRAPALRRDRRPEQPELGSLIPGLQRPLSRGWVRLASSRIRWPDRCSTRIIWREITTCSRLKQMVNIGREIFATRAFSNVVRAGGDAGFP